MDYMDDDDFMTRLLVYSLTLVGTNHRWQDLTQPELADLCSEMIGTVVLSSLSNIIMFLYHIPAAILYWLVAPIFYV